MTLEQQFLSNQDSLKNFLFHKCNKDQDLTNDMFQDLYIKLYNIQQSGKYIEQGRFMYWVKRIAHNMVIDHYRKNTKLQTYSIDAMSENFDGDSDFLDRYISEDEEYVDTFVSESEKAKLTSSISMLPKKQQDIVNMRYFRNMPYSKIVLETGESQSNLLPRMHYAIKKLKKMMNGERE